MIIIPGILIALLTFPGVIIHEAAHMLFCRWYGLAVFDVKFFRFALRGPSGYVVHEPTDNFKANFLISAGPFLLNTVLCLLFCLPAYLPMHYFEVDDPLAFFFIWLGISIGMHAIPSSQDASNLWQAARRQAGQGNKLLLALCFPVVLIIHVGNILRFFWADFFYAAAVGILLPGYLFKVFFRLVG